MPMVCSLWGRNIMLINTLLGCMFVIVAFFILRESRKHRQDMEDFKKLGLKPLLELLKESNLNIWLSDQQINLMWHNPSSKQEADNTSRFYWITRVELEKLHSMGILDRSERINHFDGDTSVEYKLR